MRRGRADVHDMTYTFQLQSAQGTSQYFYATSSKGGTADVFIDGKFAGTVNDQGGSGSAGSSMHQPTSGISASFNIVGQGSHTFELRDLNGAGYVHKICVPNGISSTHASA